MIKYKIRIKRWIKKYQKCKDNHFKGYNEVEAERYNDSSILESKEELSYNMLVKSNIYKKN